MLRRPQRLRLHLLSPMKCHNCRHPASAFLHAQVPTFQPTQGDTALGLEAALGQLSFQEMLAEPEPAAEEQPGELPEWACA